MANSVHPWRREASGYSPRRRTPVAPGTDPLIVTLGAMRQASGLSMSTVAARMKTTQSQVCKVETGAQSPTVVWLRRYLNALDLDVQVVSRRRGDGAG